MVRPITLDAARVRLTDRQIHVVGNLSTEAVITTILSATFPDSSLGDGVSATILQIGQDKLLRDRIVEVSNGAWTAELQPGEKVST